MKNNKLPIGIILASVALIGVSVTICSSISSNVSASLNKNADSDEYRIVLNKDNGATVAEVGTWDDSSSETNLGTRYTDLNNPIDIQFASSKAVINDESPDPLTKFCQMPNKWYGWVTNKTSLKGIKKIKVNVQQTDATFRIDLSSTHTLEDYYYSAPQPSYVSYRSDEYTGSTSYEIYFTGVYNYLRFQSLGSTLTLTSLEIYYSCKEEEPPRGTLVTNASTTIELMPNSVSLGGKITVDYKYVDPVTDESKGVSMFLGSSTTERFGNYKIYKDSIETKYATYTGVTFQSLSDGYNRVTFTISELTNVYSGDTAPTIINTLMFRWFEPTKGVYFDVKSEPVAKNRGVFNRSGSYSSIKLFEPYTVSEGGTLIVEYKYADPIADKSNGVSMFFGSDDTHRFGNYKIYRYSLDQTYNGISFEALDDCYFRMTIDISLLDIVRSGETRPTVISEISFKWFEASSGIYFDVNPADKPIKTTDFQMSDNDFKVVNFTDIHVDDESLLADSGTTGKTIKYAISNSQPDLIVLSGDIAGSSSDLGYICEYFDNFKIPYFVVLGNHDHDFLGYETIEYYLNNSRYGYIIKGPDELNSQGNYTIQIKNSNGTLVHGLVMMDTGNKYTVTDDTLVEYVSNPVTGVKYGSFKDKTTYCVPGSDGLRGNQITWYSNTVAELGCDTSLICHIPSLDFAKAFEGYQDAVNKKDQEAIAACAPIGQCNMGEPSCGSIENLGLFKAIKESNSTKNVICGHDHLNDFSLLYDGVRLTYALKTGEGSYWKEDGTRCGYTELTIDSTGATTLDQIYFNPLA